MLYSEYRSILPMQIMENGVASTTTLIDDVRNACCCVKFWSREFAERVEVHAVNGPDKEAENQLLYISG